MPELVNQIQPHEAKAHGAVSQAVTTEPETGADTTTAQSAESPRGTKHVLKRGETLQQLAGEYYNEPAEWRRILERPRVSTRGARTRPRTITLSPEAVMVLRRIPRVPGNPYVIPGRIKGRRMRNLSDPWDVICERAGLQDMRLHDCRHSYASRALALGESLPMIGRLLGHTQVETTARYAHLAQDSVKESAARVADSIAAIILKDHCAG